MEMPAMFKGESLTRLAQGAAVGAVATMIIGFNWGGWVLGKTAENNATTCKCCVGASLWASVYRQIQASAQRGSEVG